MLHPSKKNRFNKHCNAVDLAAISSGPSSSGALSVLPPPSTNPFAPPASDLLCFDTPPKNAANAAAVGQMEPTNPFAIVAELNSRSAQQALPFGAASSAAPNPFLPGGASHPPPFAPQPPMAPPTVNNPFGAPSTPQAFGGVPYGGTHAQYAANSVGGGGTFWPPPAPPQQQHTAAGFGIYSQTPFSGTDGSYSTPSALQQNMEHQNRAGAGQFAPQWPVPSMNNGGTGRVNGGRELDAVSAMVGQFGVSQGGGQLQQSTAQHWHSSAQNQTPFGVYPSLSSGNPYGAA
uniref:Clathrin assembly protein n=1 Tax=Globodera pallida TaxID=36090 RepID=A0A183CFA0_GLOPA